jgi:hypothetical protein
MRRCKENGQTKLHSVICPNSWHPLLPRIGSSAHGWLIVFNSRQLKDLSGTAASALPTGLPTITTASNTTHAADSVPAGHAAL